MKIHTIQIGESIAFEVSENDIQNIKRNIRQEGYETYDKMLNTLSHPASQLRILLIPSSKVLMKALNVCIKLPWILHIATLFFIFALGWKSWWWLIIISIFIHGILSYTQTQLNWELGARLLAIDANMNEYLNDPEKSVNLSFDLLNKFGLSNQGFIDIL